MVDVKGIINDPPQWLSDPLTKAQSSLDEGATPDALKVLREVLVECRKKGQGDAKVGEGLALLLMADASFRGNDFEFGAQYSSEALHLFQSMKHSNGEAAALTLVSKAYLKMGDAQEAVAIADEALKLSSVNSSKRQVALCNAAVASAALASLEVNADAKMQAKALEAAQVATSALRGEGNKTMLAEVVSNLSLAYLLAGNTNMALAKAKEAQRINQSLMSVMGEAQALVLVSRALHKEGSTDDAIQQAIAAAKLFESCGDGYGQASAYAFIQHYEAASELEKLDLAKRVTARLSSPSSGDSSTIQPRFFVPQKERPLISTGPAVITFKGFMGRSAAAAPQPTSKPRKQYLVYNVCW